MRGTLSTTNKPMSVKRPEPLILLGLDRSPTDPDRLSLQCLVSRTPQNG